MSANGKKKMLIFVLQFLYLPEETQQQYNTQKEETGHFWQFWLLLIGCRGNWCMPIEKHRAEVNSNWTTHEEIQSMTSFFWSYPLVEGMTKSERHSLKQFLKSQCFQHILRQDVFLITSPGCVCVCACLCVRFMISYMWDGCLPSERKQ